MMRSVQKILAALACAMGALLMVTNSATAAAPPPDTILVDWDQTWLYLAPPRSANNPDLAENQLFTSTWFEPDYNTAIPVTVADDDPGNPSGVLDMMWQTGQAPFDYGGVNVLSGTLAPNTMLTQPASGDRYSVYFRTTFELSQAVTNPLVQVALDDMARWFLDGVEIPEISEAPNAGGALPLYTDEVGLDTEDAIQTYTLPGTITAGEHTLAVVVHNDAPTSTDLGFATQIVLPGAARVWEVNASASWQDATNWRGDDIPTTASEYAVFGSAIAAVRSIWSDQDVVLDGIQFDNPNRYVIGGQGTLTLQGNARNASLNSVAGSHELQMKVVLANDTDSNIATYDDGTNPTAPASLMMRNQFNLGGHTLTKEGGGELLVFSNSDPGTSGTVELTEGSLAGDGTVFGTVHVASGASVYPTGFSSGSEGRASHLTIADDATFDAGSNLTLRLYGNNSNDRLIVGGELAMNGSIEVVFDSAVYTPANGDSFDLVDWGTVAGPLPTPTLPDIGALSWNTSAFGTTGVISIGDVPPTGELDYDNDGDIDSDDVNLLTRAGNLVTGVNQGDPGFDARFDLNTDNVINGTDLSQWLSDAATENGWAEPYLLGDTNLDGTVNFADFVNMNNNWQQTQLGNGDPVAWGFGDFNGDGVVNFSDFVAQNNNWQRSISMAGQAAAVPEPAGLALFALGILGLAARRRA